MPGKKVFIYLFCFVALVACGNNPYPPDSGKMIGYSALGEDPRTLDPAQVSDTTSAEVLTQIYDALYQNAYLDRPYRVVPALAADYPAKRIFSEDVSDNGTIKKVAKDGVRLHLERRHLFSG